MCVCVSIVCTSIAQQQHVTPLTMFEKLRAGGYAGVTAQFLIYPLEVVKTRLAVAAPRTYAGGWDCLSGTYRREGLSALYRGLSPSIIGIIPYAAIDLSCFETLKRAYLRWHNYSDDHHPPVFVLLGCGAMSSALGQVVSYPLALLRARMQADGMPGRPRKYRSAREAFMRTITERGSRTLYRGVGPNLAKSVPAAAVGWAVYETCMSCWRENVF
eukprot:GHVU01097603.1.p1 GENE.GHVU01097603.1~~GHVU01097603.1.p1  ORF type:complete len:215 (-),score=15.97 GHVU01097603.1:598-1242(-)